MRMKTKKKVELWEEYLGKQIGKKVCSCMSGEMSIKFFESGVIIRKRGQSVLVLLKDEQAFLCEELNFHQKSREIISNLEKENQEDYDVKRGYF